MFSAGGQVVFTGRQNFDNNNDNDNDNDNDNKLYLYSVYIMNCSRRFTISQKNVLKLWV